MNSIMGSPSSITVGRNSLLVGYVSMLEWQVFSVLLKQDEKRALQELLYYSLHRANSNVTRGRARRLVRRCRKKLSEIVDLICVISLPKMSAQPPATTGTDTDTDSERNTKTIYRLLSRMHGWTPRQIGDMAPCQVYSYLMGGQDGSGIAKMSGSEYQNFRSNRGMN